MATALNSPGSQLLCIWTWEVTGAGNQGKRAGKQPWIRRPHQKPRQDVSLLACWLAKINFLALAPSQRGWLCKLFGGNLSLLLGYNAAG